MAISIAGFAQQVNIVSPAAGEVTSPVRVVANFSSTATIDAISVLVDNVEIKQLEAVTPLDISVPMSPGGHVLTVKAMQSNGVEISSSRTVTVSAPLNPTSTLASLDSASLDTAAASTTSSTGSTYSSSNPLASWNIEEKSGWYTYPDQGSPTCSSKPALLSSPSVDGISGRFYLGPNGQFNNCLWPILLGSNSSVTHFTLDTHYRLSSSSAPQGVEFSSNKHIGTQWYKFSVQCSYYKGIFSVWDTAGNKWSATTIPCKRPASGSWDHLTVNTQISNGKAVFLSLTLNGVTHTINKSFYPLSKSSSESYGVHVQMDGNRAGNSYYMYVDELTFKAW